MKKYISPQITTYFAENAAFPAVVAAFAGGVAYGISAGFLAGKREIYKGKCQSLVLLENHK